MVECDLSKMQKIRKRELRRAMTAIRDRIKFLGERPGINVYGLREAIRLISEMRKAINLEVRDGR